MASQYDKIEERLEKIQEEISEMGKTLAVNTKQLEIHIEGVKLAREQNELLKLEVEKRFKLVNSHISFVRGSFWTLTILCAIILGLNELGILKKIILLFGSV